jgi:hypothetical protein
VRRALDFVLARAEPNPALAVDRGWRMIAMNRGAQKLSAFFLDPEPELLAVADNAMKLLFHPRGLCRYVVNWPEVAAFTLDRLEREALQDPEGAGALLAALRAWPAPAAGRPKGDGVLVPVHLRKGGVELRMATLLATLGAPVDVTARELTVEIYYPLDEATEAWLAR